MLAGGAPMLAIGAGWAIYVEIFLHRSVAADGSVVGLVPVQNQDDGQMNYAPTFTFTAADGKLYTLTSGTASNPPGFTVGQPVKVLYIKGDPSGAKLDTFWQLWFIPVVFESLGVVFTGMGLLFLRHLRRRRPIQVAASIHSVLNR